MFRLTYSTMFDPPEALHAHFDDALRAVRGTLGAEHAMWIGGEDVRAAKSVRGARARSTQRVVLGRFQSGDAAHAAAALDAAARAFPAWAATPWRERVAILRRAADADRGARLRDRRGARARGRQEPDGGARRSAGDRRPDPLLLRPDGGERRLRAARWRATRSPASRARTRA